MRRGFTLLEMLVATAIFVTGFLAVYTMFLVGVRSRTVADATTRGAIVATSLMSEMRLRAINDPVGSSANTPAAWLGDGIPPALGADSLDNTSWDAQFYAHPDAPGMYYRIDAATDLKGNAGTVVSDAIAMTILVGQLDSNQPTLTYQDLRRRYNLPSAASPSVVADNLLQRGILQRYDAVIHRERRHHRP